MKFGSVALASLVIGLSACQQESVADRQEVERLHARVSSLEAQVTALENARIAPIEPAPAMADAPSPAPIEQLRANVQANQTWAEKASRKAWENDQAIMAEINRLRKEDGLKPIEPECIFPEGCMD